MQYRKKPVVIDAVQWKGDNIEEVMLLCSGSDREIGEDLVGDSLSIKTLEGTMTASKEDFIIKGVKGEIYPCKPDID